MLIGRDMQRRRVSRPGSFPLEQLSLTPGDGRCVRVALKRLVWNELDREARLARPRFLFDAEREPSVYRWLLPKAPPGPARYLGSSSHGGCWLFLEWVEGRELFQVGELDVWCRAARWLGELHAGLAAGASEHAVRGRLLVCDAPLYRRWMHRAKEFGAAGPSSRARSLSWLARRHETVVEALCALPRTVLHGDFNASNVLVAGDGEDLRIAPVDWELAALGPGLLDLAALLSGDWDARERAEMAAAYAGAEGLPPFSPRELDFARLQLTVQWLGWAPSAWMPPEGQRHDWLAAATELAEELEL